MVKSLTLAHAGRQHVVGLGHFCIVDCLLLGRSDLMCLSASTQTICGQKAGRYMQQHLNSSVPTTKMTLAQPGAAGYQHRLCQSEMGLRRPIRQVIHPACTRCSRQPHSQIQALLAAHWGNKQIAGPGRKILASRQSDPAQSAEL